MSDAPRDTTRGHLIVAGGRGLPVFYMQAPNFLLLNGSVIPRPLRMTVGDTNRIRIVSIHADEVLHFRFGTEDRWRAGNRWRRTVRIFLLHCEARSRPG